MCLPCLIRNIKGSNYSFSMVSEDNKVQGHKIGHHKDRNDIIGEHRFSDIGQLILFILFMVLWILDSFVFHFSTFLNEYIKIYISAPIGGVILLISGYLAFTGLKIVFVDVREQPEVIKTGVFKFTRHPIYLGSILLYFGLTLITLSIASLGFLVLISAFYEYIATYEEHLLEENFGDQYTAYAAETRKWVPIPKTRDRVEPK